MKTEQVYLMPMPGGNSESNSRNLAGKFTKYLHRWQYFLVSLLIAFGGARFYISTLKPVYAVKAKLSIKDDKKAPEEKETLEGVNITGAPKTTETELEIIKSRVLVSQVVNDLQLWAGYSEPVNYINKDLYSNSPVKFKLLTSTEALQAETLTVYIESADRFVIKNTDGKQVHAAFKDTLKNNFGSWKLDTTGSIKQFIGKTIAVNLQNPETVVNQYENRLIITMNKVAPIIELELDDEVKSRGVAFLNQLIKDYQLNSIEDKNRVTANTLKFIETRLASLTGELNDAEHNVEGYKSSIGLTDISSKSKFYLENVQNTDNRLADVTVQLRVIDDIEKYVNSPSGADNIPSTLGVSDPGLTNLVDQLGKLQLQRVRMLAITPESNPIFEPIDKQISSVKAAIKASVNGIKSSLLTTSKQLQNYSSGFEASIKDIPGEERQYISIKRQQIIKENLYIYLLQKKEEVSLSYASVLTGIRTVESPYSMEPMSKKQIPYILALMFGLGLPLLVIYSVDVLKSRITNRDEIETDISAPIIGELNQEKVPNGLIMFGKDNFAIAEQFRSLRTSIQYIVPTSQQGRVTMLTSSISGEGKSFVTGNLAVTLAMMGRKTVILESDLRKPQLNKIFSLDDSHVGLGDYLQGRASKAQILQPSKLHDNLYFVSSGSIPENPSELLENMRLDFLINELRVDFDDILIDTPPLHLVTDAMILAPLCDMTLYIVKQGYTPKSELKFIKQLSKEEKLPKLHILFNGIIRKKYGYGYNYDNSYYVKPLVKQLT